MTRDEFIEEINSFSDLINWCSENNCDVCSDIWYCDSYDEWVSQKIEELGSDGSSWQYIRDRLNSMESGFDWYRMDRYGDFVGIDDDDFEDYKDAALEWGDDTDIWDARTRRTTFHTDADPEDAVPIEEEDISIDDMFASSNDVFSAESGAIATLKAKERSEAIAAQREEVLAADLAEEQEVFEKFLSGICGQVLPTIRERV